MPMIDGRTATALLQLHALLFEIIDTEAEQAAAERKAREAGQPQVDDRADEPADEGR